MHMHESMWIRLAGTCRYLLCRVCSNMHVQYVVLKRVHVLHTRRERNLNASACHDTPADGNKRCRCTTLYGCCKHALIAMPHMLTGGVRTWLGACMVLRPATGNSRAHVVVEHRRTIRVRDATSIIHPRLPCNNGNADPLPALAVLFFKMPHVED